MGGREAQAAVARRDLLVAPIRGPVFQDQRRRGGTVPAGVRAGSTGSLLVSQKGKRKAGIAARCPERCLLVGNTEIREIVRYSRNARFTWSVSGFIRYDITVRSPVFTKASTGIPGTSLTWPRRATSSGGIAMRIV